jgi:hypothetical protein
VNHAPVVVPAEILATVSALPLPAGVAVAVVFISAEAAVAFISAEAVVVSWFQHLGSERSFQALFILGVMVVSAGWCIGLALATSLLSGVACFYLHLGHGGATGADDFIALARWPSVSRLALRSLLPALYGVP